MDARDWDARYAELTLDRPAAGQPVEPNEFVVSELTGLAPGRAYDMACGGGRNAIWLAGRGWQVTAADFSATGLELARGRAEAALGAASARIDWQLADATRTGPVAGAYDLVLVSYLQLPAEQRRLAVRAAAAGLAPGATLLVVAHDATNLAEGWGGPQHPEVLYTAEELLADLAGLTGLRTVRAGRVARTVRGGGQQHTAWDALVRVRAD
ncbi:MAG TPA: class I SAM-dependent methyltransferase [Jatrophihabitans sp.]|nr:class I SAM-dependent methyltransferase [Jatrophihabitans sp.]